MNKSWLLGPLLPGLSDNWELFTSKKKPSKIVSERSARNYSSLQGDMNKIIFSLIDKERAEEVVVYVTFSLN